MRRPNKLKPQGFPQNVNNSKQRGKPQKPEGEEIVNFSAKLLLLCALFFSKPPWLLIDFQSF
jgi:hypothetical protein